MITNSVGTHTSSASLRWRRDPDNRERSRTFDRRVDTERWLTSVEHATLSGAYIDPAAERLGTRFMGNPAPEGFLSHPPARAATP